LYLKESKALGEGRGNTFIVFLKRGRQEIAVEAGNSRKDPGTSEETIPEGQAGANCESHWKKMIGKPYSGAKLDRRETNRTYGLMRGSWR
jgi:hypothetical protein